MIINKKRNWIQTMMDFGPFKVRRLKRRMKASKPFLYTNFYELYNIRHFNAFVVDSVQSKKPSVARSAYRSPMP